MLRNTFFYAAVLILSGLGIFALTEAKTALIAFLLFGVLALICGFVGLKAERRKHAMHAAAVVGLLGTLIFFMGAKGALGGLREEDGIRVAHLSMMWLGIVSAVFLGLCVRSFIQARKARQKAESPAVDAPPPAT